MRTAIVGIGAWGSTLLRNLVAARGVDRVVAVDLDVERLEKAYVRHPGLRTHQSLDECLTDELVQSVVVATPVTSHFGLAKQALQASRHVYVEKPLTASSATAIQLCELAESRGLVLMVGHLLLFSPPVNKVRDLVQGGHAGKISHVSTRRQSLGRFRDDANVIWDLCPHDFSVIFHVLDEYPDRVQTAARATSPGGQPHVAFVNLWFPSGILANVTVSWLAPRKVRTMMVVGQDRMVQYDDTSEEPVKIFEVGRDVDDRNGQGHAAYRKGDIISPHVNADEPVSRELEHFEAAVNGARPIISDGRLGVVVVEALEAADRSWQLGGLPVDIGQLPN